MTAPAPDDRDRIRTTLARIAEALTSYGGRATPRGLLNGSCGIALFYAYYFQWTQDEQYLDHLHHVVVESVASLAVEQPVHSHCSGLGGIAWCIQHLVSLRFIDADPGEDVFSQVDPVLARSMDDALTHGRHDFLHEGLGIALYFLEKLPDPAARAALERAVDRLAHSASDDGGAIRWQDRFTQRAQERGAGPIYNLGLAHGTPAIISILARLHTAGIATSVAEPLLRGSARWLIAARQRPGRDRVSWYPIMVDAANQPIGPSESRLGWCYGDLSAAVALLHAGTALGDRAFVDESRAILEHTARHRTARNGAVEDAGLCHGSIGISHIYRRAYLATGDELFAAGARQWLGRTLELGSSEGRAAGFRSRLSDTHVDCFDLLQGIAGVGLGLLAALDPETPPAWDRCLLLS